MTSIYYKAEKMKQSENATVNEQNFLPYLLKHQYNSNEKEQKIKKSN